MEFFAETRHSYGRTALFLSGGAHFGKYHFGVLKALYEQDLFPRVIAGSSAGALVAACICGHKYSEVWKVFCEDYNAMTTHALHWKFPNYWEAFKMLRQGKSILDNNALKEACYRFCKDMTFLEIYEQNKWNLNITVTDGVRQGDSKLLNYLTAPNIVVWSAVVASCAIPGFYDSVELMIKTEKGDLKPYYMSKLKGNFKFIDGSVACDLPMNRMSELFNINTFIVSQVNPHVAPFISSDGFSHDKSRLRRRLFVKARNLMGNEIQHWITQLTYLGLFPEYVQGIADLVMQTYRGHVTIAPRPTLYDYKRLIEDVEPSNFHLSLQHTYSQTIQRISHIRSLFGIEREFDRYYMRLKNKLHCQIHLRHDKDLIKFQINKALKEK